MAWFGLSRWNIERAARPWGERPSILRSLEAAPLLDPTRGGPPELPDEHVVRDGGICWAAGARDGVSLFHMGRGDSEETGQAVWSAIVAVVEAASDATVKRLYEAAMKGPTASAADAIVARVEEANSLDRGRALRLARWLTREAADREAVKLGVVLLGTLGNAGDRPALERLARHEEFTLFAVVALLNRNLATWRDLWEIAKDVHGWGRVHAVLRLAKCEDPRVRRWLLREGFRNAVMDEYLALVCAEAGDLAGELAEDQMDAELLDGAASLLSAIAGTTLGGPSNGFEAYPGGVAAVRGFLSHAARRAGSLEQLLGASRLLQFVESSDIDWSQLAEHGWSDAVRSELAASARRVLELPEWRGRVLEEIKSTDRNRFGQASAAADHLGMDVWEAQFARLRGARDEVDACWWHVCRTQDPARMDRILAFAEETLPLDRIASGPSQDLGVGKELRPHRALDWVLQDLRRFPGRGWALLRSGLRSPVTRNRNMALTALSKWNRATWPTEARQLLEEAMHEEPEPKTRENMARVLRDQPLE
jgi:hypothetical protein